MPVKYDVLVTDDDADVRGFMSDALAYEGYTISTLPTHALTHDDIIAFQPALIIIELWYETLSIFKSFVQHIHQHAATSDVGIIFTSTDARLLKSEDWIKEATRCGALPKPFDLAELLLLVNLIIGSPQQL